MEQRDKPNEEFFPSIQLILPENLMLIASLDTRSLFFLSLNADAPPSMGAYKQFTPTEWRVLLPLLRQYPSVVMHETLFAALHGINLAESHAQIRLSRRNGSLRETLRPLRDTISRLRPKVQTFFLDIASRSSIGYAITARDDAAPHTSRKKRRK
jgi:hypothetical protein